MIDMKNKEIIKKLEIMADKWEKEASYAQNDAKHVIRLDWVKELREFIDELRKQERMDVDAHLKDKWLADLIKVSNFEIRGRFTIG